MLNLVLNLDILIVSEIILVTTAPLLQILPVALFHLILQPQEMKLKHKVKRVINYLK